MILLGEREVGEVLIQVVYERVPGQAGCPAIELLFALAWLPAGLSSSRLGKLGTIVSSIAAKLRAGLARWLCAGVKGGVWWCTGVGLEVKVLWAPGNSGVCVVRSRRLEPEGQW